MFFSDQEPERQNRPADWSDAEFGGEQQRKVRGGAPDVPGTARVPDGKPGLENQAGPCPKTARSRSVED